MGALDGPRWPGLALVGGSLVVCKFIPTSESAQKSILEMGLGTKDVLSPASKAPSSTQTTRGSWQALGVDLGGPALPWWALVWFAGSL